MTAPLSFTPTALVVKNTTDELTATAYGPSWFVGIYASCVVAPPASGTLITALSVVKYAFTESTVTERGQLSPPETTFGGPPSSVTLVTFPMLV